MSVALLQLQPNNADPVHRQKLSDREGIVVLFSQGPHFPGTSVAMDSVPESEMWRNINLDRGWAPLLPRQRQATFGISCWKGKLANWEIAEQYFVTPFGWP